MKISASSKLLWNNRVRNAVEIIAREGFDGIELWAEHLWRDEDNLQQFKEFLLSTGLDYSVHAATRDLNLASANKAIRQVSIDQARKSMETCALLGGEIVTIHPGSFSSSKEFPVEVWKRQLDAFQELAVYAEQYQVLLAVENMELRPRELVVEPDDLERLLKGIDSSRMGITLDLAHLTTLEQWDPLEYLKAVNEGHSILNVHLSDGDGKRIHLPLGTGRIDFLPLLEWLQKSYQGHLTVEGFTPGQELQNLKVMLGTWARLNSRLVAV